ncbi:NAD(P)-dependent oxidoreductase [Mycobacterium sp. 852014-52144_SCH5372336]|uniref:NAD-dependent epimerase/dehydratase family protein n=1 Tax=Mycobacterium sp. 852014-52144_SCH5372336 TaxID=1834115 RepID=UPI0007FDC444|nr:NAD(P)-dependent oxidoreductase [Mycobacterium sp. 852014-52144_SCH5372336]OBB73368.1 epimerase [Mycobacterium sp. 852014-52144_SCH5372336]
MRIMVTGGAGFVGKQLVQILKERSELLVADLLRYGTPDWLGGEPDGFAFRRIDIRDAAETRNLVKDFAPDVIVHLAAIHYIPECDDDPANAVATNVAGTVNLLSACPEGTRFVLASSGAVYQPDEAAHRELESVVAPADIYGFTKQHGEDYLRKLTASRGLAGVIVRLFNVIGPGETNPHLLPAIVAQLREDPNVVYLGNTWPKRDYIDVLDAAEGFAAAALGTSPEAGSCDVVNLGSGQQYSVDEIVKRLKAITGLSFEVHRDERRVRAVDRPFLGADISRIRERFGWMPKRGLDETLKRMWDNPDFLPALEGRLT